MTGKIVIDINTENTTMSVDLSVRDKMEAIPIAANALYTLGTCFAENLGVPMELLLTGVAVMLENPEYRAPTTKIDLSLLKGKE